MKTLLSLTLLTAIVVTATPVAAQDVTAADTNRDGRITRAEFAAARLANFARFDRNHDGVVSPADLGRIARFRPQAAEALRLFIAGADINHDGQVTRAELAKAPMPVFDRADANHDGVVDGAETAALRADVAQMRGR